MDQVDGGDGGGWVVCVEQGGSGGASSGAPVACALQAARRGVESVVDGGRFRGAHVAGCGRVDWHAGAGRGKTAPHDLPPTEADYPYLKTFRHH